MSNNPGNTLLAVLIGAAIGTGVGILFAPDKGSRTREKIKDGFDEAKDELKHKLEHATVELKHKFSTAKGDLEESFDEMVSKMSTKTDDVITILEAKLAELKEQNSKLQKDKPSTKNT
jgi:gas vesicle protein